MSSSGRLAAMSKTPLVCYRTLLSAQYMNARVLLFSLLLSLLYCIDSLSPCCHWQAVYCLGIGTWSDLASDTFHVIKLPQSQPGGNGFFFVL